MYIILGIMSLFAGITGVICICKVSRNLIMKRKRGKYILGRKVNCKEIYGQPKRYVVEVEYNLDNVIKHKKIVTTDKKINRYNDNEQIPLIYVDIIDKIFWTEDSSHEKFIVLLLLSVFCFFMFLLTGSFFAIYFGVII